MNQLFELIEIKSVDDLPKDVMGDFICVRKDATITAEVWVAQPITKHFWIQYIHSYFRPVQVSKEVVYVEVSVYDDLPEDKESYVHTIIAGVPCGNKPKNFTQVRATHWLRKTESLIVKQ